MTKAFGGGFRLCARALCLVVVMPALFLIEPFWKIRLGLIYTQRIGHLAPNTDLFLRRLQLHGHPSRTTYLFFGWDAANKYLFRMFSRYLPIYESRFGTRLLFAWRPLLENTRFWEGMRYGKKREILLMSKTRATLTFSANEEREGERLLEQMGIGRDDWFVCFHARDGGYLRQWRPQHNDVWKKTDYRNLNVENYLPAAEYITQKGGFAVRMGAFVDQPLAKTDNPRIIDYATRYRSEFMDIFLSSRCRFFLASSSGIDKVPLLFDRPVAMANVHSYSYPLEHERNLLIPRLIVSKKDGRHVPYPQAEASGFGSGRTGPMDPDAYAASPFRWKEHNSDDVLNLCKDMLDKLDGIAPPDGAAALQERYAELYWSHNDHYRLASPVAPRFLLKHKDLIFPKGAEMESHERRTIGN